MRAKLKILPKVGVGPYVEGGYVPRGYRAASAAELATYSTSASESSG